MGEIPNSNIQAPKKFQSPKNQKPAMRVHLLGLGVWSFFGFWNLEFGACGSALYLHPWLILMDAPLIDLRNALRERLAIISDEQSRRDPAAHMARLRNVSEKIERLAGTLPRPLDPQLAHYLNRKSYDKALEFLEQRGKAF